MGDDLLISCDNQEEWDEFLEKSTKVVVSFITSNSPSRELIQTMKGLASDYSTAKFLQVDVNNFKPKNKGFTVTEVPSVMFVNNKVRKFDDFSDLNADKLKKKITELVGDDAKQSPESSRKV